MHVIETEKMINMRGPLRGRVPSHEEKKLLSRSSSSAQASVNGQPPTLWTLCYGHLAVADDAQGCRGIPATDCE